MEVFVAPPKGIIEMKLLKFRYIPQLNASIDGAAKESAHSVSILDGIKNFKQKVIQTKISGHDARLVSIQADRWGGKIGVESLIIYNQRNNTMWQLQLLFGKKKGINPFKSLNIETEQNYSKILLKSVKVLN